MTELRVTFARLSLASAGGLCVELQVRQTLSQQIKEKQLLDGDLLKKIRQVEQGVKGDIDINAECILNFRGRLCVPQNVDLRQVILNEVHSSPYPMHPGNGKMYHDLRKIYWWAALKHDKWERIITDFISSFPLTLSRKDLVRVIVDRFLKSAHFVAVRTNYSLQKLAELYIVEIVRLHGVLVSIISNRDLRFTSSFQASIHMAPFEALYGKKCRNPFCWTKLDEKRVVGVDLVRETEEKVLRLGRKGKLSPRYVRPNEVVERVGPVAYPLKLPPEVDQIHDVFHVSMLQKYLSDSLHIVPVEEIEVQPNLTFDEEPIEILDHEMKVL
ncbi:uncharacterized protein [Gossypium hirsutum]|uniref:Integrase zinc-binding domain-containing protein n=1 Tax=Gossypium hirsutum TaxID=3635 RepID=A0A1U8KX59_GOSHI|nr:uncharacterized protein LOC107921709 [Gossypium hirsutum]